MIAALVAISSNSMEAQQRRSSGSGDGGMPPRDEWQRVSDIISAMGDVRGKRVADIAAGKGYLTSSLAKAVGKGGRVYAVEIGAVELEALGVLARTDSLRTIEVVEGTITDPRLPAEVDAAVVLNSYHEFTQHRDMLAGIRKSLRPGALLVLVDNSHPDAALSREEQASRHAIHPSHVERELRAAGFEIVQRTDAFINQPYMQQWLIVARPTK
jgi:predicted methyltransferase